MRGQLALMDSEALDVSPAGHTLPVRPAARQTDPSTSHDAAEQVHRHAHSTTLAILDVLDAHGSATGDEIWARMADRNDGTVKSAISRLRAQGLVVAAGRRYPFNDWSRCAQTVWQISDAGRQWLRYAAQGHSVETVDVSGGRL